MRRLGETRGSWPDEELRRQIVNLRALGLSFTLIAQRLRCSRQNVHQVMRYAGLHVELPALRCQECRADILKDNKAAGPRLNNGAVFCLDCLARHPEAAFGQRLKAHRLAAGLTLGELSRRTGIPLMQLSKYERGAAYATWPSLVKLLRVFGVGLVDVWGKES